MIESPPPEVTIGTRIQRDRATDGGFLCLVALRASQLWEFIDRRDIDKHTMSVAIFSGTVVITRWAMGYAELHADKAGLEVAAVMAAILAPYMALQAAAISFYFRARTP